MTQRRKPARQTIGEFVEGRRALARECFTKHGFVEAKDPTSCPDMDRYFRLLPYRGPNTGLRAHVSHSDGEIELTMEEGRRPDLLCKTCDLSEVESWLSKSRFRLRFPRIHEM